MKRMIVSLVVVMISLLVIGCSNGKEDVKKTVKDIDTSQFEKLHSNEILNKILNRYNRISLDPIGKKSIDQESQYETIIQIRGGFVYLSESDVRNCIDLRLEKVSDEGSFLLMTGDFIRAIDADITDKNINKILTALKENGHTEYPYSLGEWVVTLYKSQMNGTKDSQYILEARMNRTEK